MNFDESNNKYNFFYGIKVNMNFSGGKGRTYQKYINLMPPHDILLMININLHSIISILSQIGTNVYFLKRGF